jgi:hypothetical protein
MEKTADLPAPAIAPSSAPAPAAPARLTLNPYRVLRAALYGCTLISTLHLLFLAWAAYITRFPPRTLADLCWTGTVPDVYGVLVRSIECVPEDTVWRGLRWQLLPAGVVFVASVGVLQRWR